MVLTVKDEDEKVQPYYGHPFQVISDSYHLLYIDDFLLSRKKNIVFNSLRISCFLCYTQMTVQGEKMEIIVFQEHDSGIHKIEGVQNFGEGISITKIISIDDCLPEFIDEPGDYFSNDFAADLVLNYLKHPDLVHYLISLCTERGIPVVSAGKKGAGFTPFTCCGLGKNDDLGVYGERFGFPEYKVVLKENRIVAIQVLRGAPCGATWDALKEYEGCLIEDVLTRLPRQVQYFCSADPSAFDPVTGKSAVHFAGYVHIAALKKAIEEAGNS